MGKVVEKKKKKKGRPTLIETQKRKIEQEKLLLLEQQQQLFLQQKQPNPNPNFTSPNRRFTRRNPIPDGLEPGPSSETIHEDDNSDSSERGRDRKTRLVIRLPTTQRSSNYVNSDVIVNANGGDDEIMVNAAADGEGSRDNVVEMENNASKATNTHLGTGPATPLPDKKLLLFILDRLQRKDKYRVFSDPVDPNELPDYHEVIEHPMDFSTVRAKVLDGAYFILEEFEVQYSKWNGKSPAIQSYQWKLFSTEFLISNDALVVIQADVFLICSNAMQYNAADTIYFKQARSIQELAKKDFENLRQESDDNEPQPKIVRRGRPPTRNLKKAFNQAIDRAGPEFSSDATLASRGDNTVWSNSYDLRKGPGFDRYGSSIPGSRNSDAHTSRSADRCGEYSGSTFKGLSMKAGKKQFVMDENRRNTYNPSHQSANGREPSILTTFDEEKRQLMPVVGLHTEHGYAKSLARFAAILGPTAWKIASKKIEMSLPAGTKFGRGWVGENESSQPHELLVSVSPSLTVPPHQTFPAAKVSPSSTTTATPLMADSDREILSVNQEPTPPEPTSVEPMEISKGLTSESSCGLMNNSVTGIRPHFQVHKSIPVHNPTMNGFNGGLGFSFPSQMGNSMTPVWTAGSFGSDVSNSHSQVLDMVSRNNNFSHSSMHANHLDTTSKISGSCSSTINPGTSLPNSSQPSWHGLSQQQPNQESVPPDLNRFHQSPGSPSSSKRLDSPQPDLVLQL
ncbi:hypothetical protein GIB67_020368 [Kingdonia uniflora]|uniref:Bromo domain-containing protein n=1 Tax=Kingdonia uniflora TaxID=39325 RepID=A0A7J7L504_9MAGN|nr:hypothetical protein GIB67_020368 [Kingdonia uniflora]